MNLKAYAQIPDLEDVAKANNIEISRVRGYLMMKYEDPFTAEEIKEGMRHLEGEAIEEFIANSFILSSSYIKHKKKYYWTDKKHYSHVKWNNLHGKKRKVFKYHLKQVKKAYLKQKQMWNKYCGREDVLYIHARLGFTNWSDTYHTDYKNKEWYLESIDDWWDTSYCDIFAHIKKEL